MPSAINRIGIALTCFVAMAFLIGACSSERSNIKEQPTTARETLRPYATSTVGHAASDYVLAMPRVRVWFNTVAEMQRSSRSDTTLHLVLNYAFASDIGDHVASLERNPSAVRILKAHELSPREFVILSTLVGSGLIVLHIADSAGTVAVPVNIDRSLLAFMTANRSELDSLKHLLDQ